MDQEVRTHIPRPADEDVDFGDVCHSISAYQLDLIIADICNAIVNHQQGQATFDRSIEALYPEVPHEGNDFATRRLRFTEHLASTLERYLEIGNPDAITDDLVLHFSYLAGNSPANLRMGRSDWNRFIQEHFDPTAWFYFVDEDQRCVISNAAFDEARRMGERYINLPQYLPPIPIFYIVSDGQGHREWQRLV